MIIILNINQYFINKFYFQPSVHEWANNKGADQTAPLLFANP